MNFLTRLGVAWDALRAREPAFREAVGRNIDADEANWRKLTADGKRDLVPLTRARMQEIAVYLWRGTPLGKGIIEMPVAYLLAEGVTVTVADDPEAQGWIDAFWNDPINRFDLKLERKMRELAIFGEQCWPTFVNEANGHVRLGYLDPSLIQTVVSDPDNAEQPIGVVTVKNKKGRARRYRVIVDGEENVFSARTQEIRAGFTDGDCFYTAINSLATAPRGQSDLLAVADWLDLYEALLFNDGERQKEMRAFFWDVSLKGASPEQVKVRAGEIVAPKPGSVRVHNDSEAWEAVAPDLKAGDTSTAARLFRNHILGGVAMPEHWFGGGGDVNRATAGEMGEPTLKTLTMRQRLWRAILTDIIKYVIRQRRGKLASKEKQPPQIQVNFPELTARDTTKYASALNQIVSAAGAAIERGLLSEETAVALIASTAAQLGIDIDAEDELKKARAQAGKRAEADVFRDPPPDAAPDPKADPADQPQDQPNA